MLTANGGLRFDQADLEASTFNAESLAEPSHDMGLEARRLWLYGAYVRTGHVRPQLLGGGTSPQHPG